MSTLKKATELLVSVLRMSKERKQTNFLILWYIAHCGRGVHTKNCLSSDIGGLLCILKRVMKTNRYKTCYLQLVHKKMLFRLGIIIISGKAGCFCEWNSGRNSERNHSWNSERNYFWNSEKN